MCYNCATCHKLWILTNYTCNLHYKVIIEKFDNKGMNLIYTYVMVCTCITYLREVYAIKPLFKFCKQG